MWIKELSFGYLLGGSGLFVFFCGALGSIPQQKCAGTQIDLDVFAMEASGIILLFIHLLILAKFNG